MCLQIVTHPPMIIISRRQRQGIISDDEAHAGDAERQVRGEGRKWCVCSPTTHPGSFRCRYHRPPPQYASNRRRITTAAGEATACNLSHCS
ncbi:hypothetical protein LINPERHAP1_LOCUS29987 [Linum perenne]